MKTSQEFNGSIVISDPIYFVDLDRDDEKSNYCEDLDKIGFTEFLLIDFGEDRQVVINDNNEIIGSLVSDSDRLAVVYLSDLEKYNPDYEKAFYSTDNRTIIENFCGTVGFEVTDDCTVITGTGNIRFRSCRE